MTEQEYQALLEEQKKKHIQDMATSGQIGAEYKAETPETSPEIAPEDPGLMQRVIGKVTKPLGQQDMEDARLQRLRGMMNK